MTSATRPWPQAVLWLVVLAPLFFMSYGWANHLAAARADVPSIVFGWERHIPFLPWTIVPYWSIDLFYGLSLFICSSRRELHRHALQLLTAQAIAVACFVLWPLQFSFQRPAVDGLFGALFGALAHFDLPFNQAPSLHITLLIVLWARFAAHAQGMLRGLLHVWFALIGVSVLTTWQHHFIDVPTGMLAGFVCLWMWPMQPSNGSLRDTLWHDERRRFTLGTAYAGGAILVAVAALWLQGAWLWLLWPAVSLALIATCHLLLGPAGFRKDSHGRMAWASRWLLAPCLAGAWINSRCWTRHHPAPFPIADNVWLGRLPGARQHHGFHAVVDLCAELPLPGAGSADVALPCLDLLVPSSERMLAAAAAIEQRRHDGKVWVCCALGFSRSACAVAAWLLVTGRAATVDEAIGQLQAVGVNPRLRAEHRRMLASLRPPHGDA